MTADGAYPNAPLVLTVLEVKHPQHTLSTAEAEAMRSVLRDDLPLLRKEQVQEVSFEIGSGVAPRAEQSDWHRFVSRDRRTMLSCSARVTALETTRYRNWATFRTLFERSLAARLVESGLEGIERLGLRYIDEVRIPADKDQSWAKWVHADLLPPITDIEGLDPAQQQSVVQYVTGSPSTTVTLRYGVADGPSSVIGPLRPNPPAAGKYFLFDTDSAWTQVDDEPMPEPDVDMVMGTVDGLHKWSKSLFEWWPTQALRQEIFNVE